MTISSNMLHFGAHNLNLASNKLDKICIIVFTYWLVKLTVIKQHQSNYCKTRLIRDANHASLTLTVGKLRNHVSIYVVVCGLARAD